MSVKVFRSAIDNKVYKYNGDPEQTTKYFAAAGIVTPSDIEAVEAKVVLDEVLGLQSQEFSLRNACRTVRMNKLVAEIPVATKLRAQEKVPPLVEAEIGKLAWDTVLFRLWKNVVPVAVSDEAAAMAAVDVMAYSVQDAARALENSANDQIKDILDAATETSSGADWTTITDGRSANNPYDDIRTARQHIERDHGFKANLLVAGPDVWGAFFANDFVKGQLQGVVYPATKMFDIPGHPGMRGLSDWAVPAETAYVLDRNQAVVLGEGPTAAEKARNAAAGFDYYVVRQWLEPKIVQEEAIYKLTSLLS